MRPRLEPPEHLTAVQRRAFRELCASPAAAHWLPEHAELVGRLVLDRERLERLPLDAPDWLEHAGVVLALLLAPGALTG